MARIQCPNVEDIVATMRRKDYRVFENPNGHDLNLVGIRNSSSSANQFDDWLCAFYWFDGIWNLFAFPGTTDPGTYYRENPLNIRGTAIMKPGQYRRAYKVGRHKGYKALQQVGSITVYRDNNRDRELDTTGNSEQQGLHAINIHRANRVRASTRVEKWSAGCQVMQDPDHFDFFMTLCERGAQKFANSFTYTLLESDDFTAD
jgi:hypothetical protein